MTPESLSALRAIAAMDQCSLDAVLEEACVDLIAKRNVDGARPHVMAAYLESLEEYTPLYKRLAE